MANIETQRLIWFAEGGAPNFLNGETLQSPIHPSLTNP